MLNFLKNLNTLTVKEMRVTQNTWTQNIIHSFIPVTESKTPQSDINKQVKC